MYIDTIYNVHTYVLSVCNTWCVLASVLGFFVFCAKSFHINKIVYNSLLKYLICIKQLCVECVHCYICHRYTGLVGSSEMVRYQRLSWWWSCTQCMLNWTLPCWTGWMLLINFPPSVVNPHLLILLRKMLVLFISQWVMQTWLVLFMLHTYVCMHLCISCMCVCTCVYACVSVWTAYTKCVVMILL